MERLNIRLLKQESVKAYVCTEIIGKAEGCVAGCFSPSGEYLAVGKSCGEVIIYCFLTHSIIQRRLLCKAKAKVLSIIWKEKIYVLTDANFLYTMSLEEDLDEPLQFDFKTSGMQIQGRKVLVFGKSDVVLADLDSRSIVSLKQDRTTTEWFGCFYKDSYLVTFGTPNNKFYLTDTQGNLIHSQEVSYVFQSAVRNFSHNSENLFLLNSRDRLLRLFEVKEEPWEFVLKKEIGDYIEKKRWSACCFFKTQPDSPYFVLACLQETGSHTLKMFDTVEHQSRVSLAKNMHSPLGSASFLCYSLNTHIHPLICVVTQAGSVLLWSSGTFLKVEKWSTSLGIPNFVELEEGNVEYAEKEDEFDEVDNSSTTLDLNPTPTPAPFRLKF